MGEYVIVKDLPASIQSALSGAGFGRKDIEVIATASLMLGGQAYGDGYMAFTVLVSLSTGASHTERGSWGGRNMFDRGNAVDNDERDYPLPPDGVVIKGQRGGGRPVSAKLYIPQSMVSRIITAGPAEPLPKVELDALAIFIGYKSFARPEYLSRANVGPEVIDGLVTRGLLKRNKAGATQVTTAGRNAASNHRAPY